MVLLQESEVPLSDVLPPDLLVDILVERFQVVFLVMVCDVIGHSTQPLSPFICLPITAKRLLPRRGARRPGVSVYLPRRGNASSGSEGS